MKEKLIKAFKMLSDELSRKNYVALYGEYSEDENDDFTMTDEVEAINTFAESGEVYADSYEALVYFFTCAVKAGWELPWANADELIAEV